MVRVQQTQRQSAWGPVSGLQIFDERRPISRALAATRQSSVESKLAVRTLRVRYRSC
jgi:hypothetical protein